MNTGFRYSVLGNRRPVTGDRQPERHCETLAAKQSSFKYSVLGARYSVHGERQLVTGNRRPVTGDRQPERHCEPLAAKQSSSPLLVERGRGRGPVLFVITLLMLWLSGITALSQTITYPVQVYTQLIPPYTPFVPSYYSAGIEKMRVTLINADMQEPVLNVYLKMKITSSTLSMQTSPAVRMPSITLMAGVPFVLSQSDLEPYFRRENLSITGGQSQFLQTLMLPDNFYRFHFEVYEVNTDRLLSNVNVGYAQAMIAAGDPPVLNLPLKGSVIQENNIPSIMFTWTPRHLNSVATAYGTEYVLSLVEIYDKQTAPDNAFQYSRVLFSETTRSTAFTYTSAQPLLQPGMRYGWRVQAVAKEGLEDAQVFKNSGYSEIFWFDYKGNCLIVSSSGVVIKGQGATVSWQPTQAIDYTLEYRKQGSSKWYPATVSGTSGILYSLQWSGIYEYRIGSRCYPNDVYDYSAVKAFTMPDLPERNPNCGILADATVSNRTPISQLTPGLPVFAGDFPVFITEVSGFGTFSGTGYVGIPFAKLPRITVTFSNITVNTDYQLLSGFFETKYDIKNSNLLWDIDETLTGGGGVSDIRTGDERAQFIVDYTIDPNIKLKPVVTDDSKDKIKEGEDYVFTKNENGKYTVVLTDSEGKEHTVESDTMPVTLEDKSGKTYLIDEKGNVESNNSIADNNQTENQEGNNPESPTDSLKKETKEFKLTDLKAIDGNNSGRVAKAGEILYYIDKPTLTNEKRNTNFEITINPNLDASDITKDKIQWTYNSTHLAEDDGNTKMSKTIVENDDATVSVNAGVPDIDEKNVQIKWVKENQQSIQVVPPAIQGTVEIIFANVNRLKQISDKFGKYGVEINPSVKFVGTVFNEEDKESRFYKSIREGGIDASVELKYNIPLPPPFSFNLTIPIVNYKIGEVGAYIDLDASIGVQGELRQEQRSDVTYGYSLVQNTIGVKVTGGIELGAKVEFLPDVESTTMTLKAYGKATLIGEGNLVYSKGEFSFKPQIYINPLVAGFNGSIKVIGYTLFDTAYEWQLLDRIYIYP